MFSSRVQVPALIWWNCVAAAGKGGHACYARVVSMAIAATVLHATTPRPADAQPLPQPSYTLASLRSGDTVRIWSSMPYHARTVAVIADLSHDRLALRQLTDRYPVQGRDTVAAAALTRLQVQRGRRRYRAQSAISGVLIGALVGGFAGTRIECKGSCSDDGEFAGLDGMSTGAFLGGLLGGFAAGLWAAPWKPDWKSVSLTR